MPPEAMAGMDADMMASMPPEAMAGAYGDMMAAMPPEAIAGMDMSMLTQIPLEAVAEVDWANVPTRSNGCRYCSIPGRHCKRHEPCRRF